VSYRLVLAKAKPTHPVASRGRSLKFAADGHLAMKLVDGFSCTINLPDKYKTCTQKCRFSYCQLFHLFMTGIDCG
jgi:hypothetical protein